MPQSRTLYIGTEVHQASIAVASVAQEHHAWVVAPALIPKKAGDWGTPNRRDAIKLARLRRAEDLPPVPGPQGEAKARRALGRARQAAPGRHTAFLRRPDSCSPGSAPCGPAPLRWRSAGGGKA